MSEFFDFHFHSVVKAFITNAKEDEYPATIDASILTQPFDLKNPIIDCLLSKVLESQSCVKQINEGKMTLGVSNIAVIEELFSKKTFIKGFLLNSSAATAPLQVWILNRIRKGEISYYQLLIKEIQAHRALAKAGKINILSRKNKTPKTGMANLVIAIEGGHGLLRNQVGRINEKDKMKVDKPDAISKDFEKNPLLPPSESLKNLQQAVWKEGADIFSLVLTHLSHIPECSLATHAYGMKILKNKMIYPKGFGLSKEGKKVIDAAYNMKVGEEDAPVLIDIKHMSIASRKEFYQYRKDNNYTAHPIIASHMGVTGYSLDDWKDARKSSKWRKKPNCYRLKTYRKDAGTVDGYDFSFNPWSINLFDEDIVEVVNSNGLIGISLDVRILGWRPFIGNTFDKLTPEYLSPSDFNSLFKVRSFGVDEEYEEGHFIESTSIEEKQKSIRHILAFCFNILHVIWVVKENTQDKDPWDYLCVGSDFDGMIDPLNSCRSWSQSGNLRKGVKRWLRVAEVAYCKEQKIKPFLPQDEEEMEKSLAKFFYENGEHFFIKQGFLQKGNDEHMPA